MFLIKMHLHQKSKELQQGHKATCVFVFLLFNATKSIKLTLLKHSREL